MGIIVCCHLFSNTQHRMMSKQLFALSLLLTYTVVSARYPLDRQLQEGADQGTGNEWQYCEDTCNKTCEPCEQHHVCAEDEIKRGEGPTRVSPDGFVLHLCSKDESCVSDKCGCPVPGNDGELCPVVCECDRNAETEICCPAGEDSNGCTIQPTCEPKGKNMYNEICPGFCVEACEYNEIACEQPDDPNNGCPHPDNCQAKQVDNSGKFCDLQQCQLVCDYTQHLCEGDILHDGCKENDICVPKQPNDLAPDGMCPGTCPVECQNWEIKCDGTIDYYGDIHKGCKGQDVCHAKAKDTNGVYCPGESDSHGCPHTCPPDEVLCLAKEGPLGCKEKAECVERTTNDQDEYCPDSSDCPTICPPNNVNCPGGVDEDGCKKPDLCIEEHRDFNGDLCPVHCPENCQDDEVFCPGTRNPVNGCYSKDKCEPKNNHIWGETPGSECPGWCPAICNEHEILCPSMIDPCNGCPTEEVCREAITDVNGQFCPGKEHTIPVEGEDYRVTGNRRGGYLSASHNCPVYCKEWKGEVQCPVYEDSLGCKPEALCVERQVKSVNSDGTKEYCPATSVCPKQCPVGKKLCHYDENDSNGCGQEDICVDIGSDSQGAPCDMDWCPPLCSGAQTLKDNGIDDIGCPLQPTCV